MNDHILAYQFRADVYCGDCIAPNVHKHLTMGNMGALQNFDPGDLDTDAENALDALAKAIGIDRYDEHSFDSDQFPKVITGNWEVDSPPMCNDCGDYIPGATPAHGALDEPETRLSWANYNADIQANMDLEERCAPLTMRVFERDYDRARYGLKYSAIRSVPIPFDWSSNPRAGMADPDQCTDWDSMDAGTCSHCGAIVGGVRFEGEDATHRDLAGGDCDGTITGGSEPMMSYYYPVDGLHFSAENAALIECLSLCLVQVGDDVGLALTGGGMDLTWDIVEAFIRLGYYPPVHFAADLPLMAENQTTERHRVIVRASFEALDAMREQMARGQERLRERYPSAFEDAKA